MPFSRDEPPEIPEPPECCGDYMDVTDEGACVCPECGRRIEPQPDVEPPATLEDWPDEPPQAPEKCPHGNEWIDCDACMHASDLAYDAAREKAAR